MIITSEIITSAITIICTVSPVLLYGGKLLNRVEHLEKDFHDFREKTGSKLDSFEEKTYSNTNRLDLLQRDIDGLSKNYERLENNVGEIRKDVNDLSRRYDKVEHSIEKLNDQFGALSKNYANLEHTAEEIKQEQSRFLSKLAANFA